MLNYLILIMKLLTPSGYASYIKTCQNAVKDDNVFNTFKQDKHYNGVLEHVSIPLAQGYINDMKIKYSKLLGSINWETVRKNDSVGGPRTHNFEKEMKCFVNLKSYVFSPSILRYVHTGLEILTHLTKVEKKASYDIVEVGCGYGGQMFVLSCLAPVFNCKINSYTFIDLAYATRLQKKFLGKLDTGSIKLNFVKYNKFMTVKTALKSSYDLFISNYCLGEIVKTIQDAYVNGCVKRCRNTFILWNSATVNEFFDKKRFNRLTEVPQTGRCNVVITNKRVLL